MKNKSLQIIIICLLIVAIIFWQIYFYERNFYSVIFFFITMLIYLGVSLFNAKRALSAVVFVAIGIVISILLRRNFDINELSWSLLALSLGVLVSYLSYKSVNR